VRHPFLACALCLALLAGVSGCGSDDATNSETQTSAATADREGGAKLDDGPLELEARASKVVIGDYEGEGPFSAVSGRKGNKKPLFKPSGQPAPRKTVIRDLEVGSGPAAQRGDEVSYYYAGADHGTGEIQYFGWPPNLPATIRLGLGTFGKSWEKTIEGMKVGGVRQVIITADYLSEEDPLDYVIVLTALQPQSAAS